MTDIEKVAKALELSRAIVAWIQITYCWEGFWHDMNWSPPDQHEKNGKKLRDFLIQYEEIFPGIGQEVANRDKVDKIVCL